MGRRSEGYCRLDSEPRESADRAAEGLQHLPLTWAYGRHCPVGDSLGVTPALWHAYAHVGTQSVERQGCGYRRAGDDRSMGSAQVLAESAGGASALQS